MTRRSMRRAALGGLLAIACSGCGNRHQTSSLRQAHWRDGEAQFGLTMPQHPRQLDPADLTVTIEDGAGAVSGAQVSAELAMPEMSMPENKTPLKMISPGVYRGAARFTMAGHWKVTLTIHTSRGTAYQHVLDPVTVE